MPRGQLGGSWRFWPTKGPNSAVFGPFRSAKRAATDEDRTRNQGLACRAACITQGARDGLLARGNGPETSSKGRVCAEARAQGPPNVNSQTLSNESQEVLTKVHRLASLKRRPAPLKAVPGRIIVPYNPVPSNTRVLFGGRGATRRLSERRAARFAPRNGQRLCNEINQSFGRYPLCMSSCLIAHSRVSVSLSRMRDSFARASNAARRAAVSKSGAGAGGASSAG